MGVLLAGTACGGNGKGLALPSGQGKSQVTLQSAAERQGFREMLQVRNCSPKQVCVGQSALAVHVAPTNWPRSRH
jgi:hypothetical protein